MITTSPTGIALHRCQRITTRLLRGCARATAKQMPSAAAGLVSQRFFSFAGPHAAATHTDWKTIDGADCPPGNGATDEERCCLKNKVPHENGGAKHWTGLSPRAVKDGKISGQCKAPPSRPPPPPAPYGCKTVDGQCVMPYPGSDYLHPKIHQSPDCLHLGGWHDVGCSKSCRPLPGELSGSQQQNNSDSPPPPLPPPPPPPPFHCEP